MVASADVEVDDVIPPPWEVPAEDETSPGSEGDDEEPEEEHAPREMATANDASDKILRFIILSRRKDSRRIYILASHFHFR